MKRYIMSLLVLAVLSVGCNESLEDTYSDYAGNGKIRYVGRCTGLDVTPGWKRLSLQWKNSMDATVDKIKVTWSSDNVQGDTLLEGNATAFELRDLAEGTYRFDICGVDKNNNESLSETNYGRPYTEDHEAVRTFTNVITKFYRVNTNFVFFTDQWNENIVDIRLKYKDVQGNEVELPLTEKDFKQNFITLSDVSMLSTDSIFILREGKLEGCPDTIRFTPFVLDPAKTYTSEFESAIRQRYGFSNQIESEKQDFDNFIDTVKVLEFDYDITSFEDVLYCPKLEKIVLGKNRYLYSDPRYETGADSSILHDKSRSLKVLDKANELMGLRIERYGKHFFNNMSISYMTDLGYSMLPVLNRLPMADVDTIRCSIEDSRADQMLGNLLDDDPTTRWETTILSYLRSYTLTIELKEVKKIRGIKISQMLFDPKLDSESRYFLPSSIIVKTSLDQADWKDVSYTEECRLGRGSGEVTLLPIAEGSRDVQYIRVIVYDQVDGSATRVKLGDIVPYY